MVDFGPTSVTKSVAPSEFGYNAPLFLSQMKEEGLEKCTSTEGQGKSREFRENTEKNLTASEPVFKETGGEKSLDDSKDSDEGFSSSFSPTSESQMLQQETSGVNSAFWGTREDFLHHEFPVMGASTPLMYSSAPGSSQLQTNSPLRRANGSGTVPTYHTGSNSRRPFPAVSTLLASNKAVANALGVSSWNSSPSPSSSWPSHSPNNGMSSNWPQSRPQLPYPLSMSSQSQAAPQSRPNKFSPFPVTNFPHKPYKNIRPTPAFNLAPTPVSSKTASSFGLQNSVSHNSGLDMTVVDDITQLTNTFSNLTTSSEVSSNGIFASQVSSLLFLHFVSCRCMFPTSVEIICENENDPIILNFPSLVKVREIVREKSLVSEKERTFSVKLKEFQKLLVEYCSLFQT